MFDTKQRENKFTEKCRIKDGAIEWWGGANPTNISFENWDIELGISEEEEVEQMEDGLYLACCSWFMDYEFGEYGTLLSSWPELSRIQFLPMKRRAWIWYGWVRFIKEGSLSLLFQIKLLFKKVWEVSEESPGLGHYMCERTHFPNALYILIKARLGFIDKDRAWFIRSKDVKYRLCRHPFLDRTPF